MGLFKTLQRIWNELGEELEPGTLGTKEYAEQKRAEYEEAQKREPGDPNAMRTAAVRAAAIDLTSSGS